MKLTLLIILMTAIPSLAQQQFKLTDASKRVDVQIDIGKCEDSECAPAKFSFFRKGAAEAFQVVDLERTQMWFDEPLANVTLRYDAQSIINFDDFNFDGVEDVALCDGNDGGYGAPSYQIYLYSPRQKKYINSPSFTALTKDGGLGMFEIDKKKKMLHRFSKSGCCWHQEEGFAVVNGKPKKVYEFTEDALTSRRPGYVEITTRTLAAGKW
jgi:hypothetical protein